MLRQANGRAADRRAPSRCDPPSRFRPRRVRDPLPIGRPRWLELIPGASDEPLGCAIRQDPSRTDLSSAVNASLLPSGDGTALRIWRTVNVRRIAHRILELHFRSEVLLDIDGEGDLRGLPPSHRHVPDLAARHVAIGLRVGRERHAGIDVARGARFLIIALHRVRRASALRSVSRSRMRRPVCWSWRVP